MTLRDALQSLSVDKDTVISFADRTYDNPPGAHIVARFQQNNIKYVLVEFKKTPGTLYTYYA